MVLLRPFPVPAEGIRFLSTNVESLVNADSNGKGTLYITEEIISWINSMTGEGFTIPYKKMTLHAISRDPAVHPSNCLYIMVNGTLDDEENIEEAEPEDDEEEETTEVRFVPDDSSVLDDVYKAVQDCTLLHPDPSSDMSEEEEIQDDDFEGYGGGDGAGEDDIGMPGGLPEGDDDDYYGNQEAQMGRLQAYLQRQLHLAPGAGQNRRRGGDRNGAANGNHQNGNPPPFNPDQFADADE